MEEQNFQQLITSSLARMAHADEGQHTSEQTIASSTTENTPASQSWLGSGALYCAWALLAAVFAAALITGSSSRPLRPIAVS